MSLKVQIIPALSDNYIYLLIADDGEHVGVVDPGDGAAVLKALALGPAAVFVVYMMQMAVVAALGILIGVVYALFKVRSPAPPGIALIGLLGMVLAERLVNGLGPLLGH